MIHRTQPLKRLLQRVSRSVRTLAVGLTLGALCSTAAHAAPGCVGRMWNPITDLDFTDMGKIQILGFTLMQAPSVGEPPEHTAEDICFCRNGLQTGLGFGLTFWAPSYIEDLARQAGCLGFMGGMEILPGFSSLSSSQAYTFHEQRKDETTNMQLHWVYADITAIVGASLFQECNVVMGSMEIPYMSELDFVWQNDVTSAIMTPELSLLASTPMLTQMACGAESIANTLGDWQNWGVCAWAGMRMPMDGVTIAKDSAQVTNMDITIKYLARAAVLGTTLQTMGNANICAPSYSPVYDPFQDRFQWSYPGKVTTRYNQNVLLWGMFIQDAGQGSLISLADESSNVQNFNVNVPTNSNITTNPNTSTGGTATAAPSSQTLNLAQQIIGQLPKPLNYPTEEAGFMQVWEARTCCLVVLTIEDVIEMIISWITGDLAGSSNQEVAELAQLIQEAQEVYNYGQIAYQFVQNPIGGVLNLIGDGITNAIGSVTGPIGAAISSSFQNLVGSGGTVTTNTSVTSGSSEIPAQGGDGLA
jgi:hypothetical protein